MIVKLANCKHCPPLDNKTMPSIQLLNTESGHAPHREKSPRIVIKPLIIGMKPKYLQKYFKIELNWIDKKKKKLCPD